MINNFPGSNNIDPSIDPDNNNFIFKRQNVHTKQISIYDFDVKNVPIKFGKKIYDNEKEMYECISLLFENNEYFYDFLIPCTIYNCTKKVGKRIRLYVDKQVFLAFGVLESRIVELLKDENPKLINMRAKIQNNEQTYYYIRSRLSGDTKNGELYCKLRIRNENDGNVVNIKNWPNTFNAIVRVSVVGLHHNFKDKNNSHSCLLKTDVKEILVIRTIRKTHIKYIDVFAEQYLNNNHSKKKINQENNEAENDETNLPDE
jgi:hypothetical protein